MDEVVEVFQDKMNINLTDDQIYFVRVLGQNNKGLIFMGLMSWNKKAEILSESKTLKGTDIFVRQDYSPDVMAIRKALKKEGRHAVTKYDQLIVLKPQVANARKPKTDTNELSKKIETEEENETTEYIEDKQQAVHEKKIERNPKNFSINILIKKENHIPKEEEEKGLTYPNYFRSK